ncbi:ion transporter [Gayadomonas joobiniege]|uniref:ion transporter n=1 Tax=Gayadomonas joobiniege TaxID=1234606 RepID=UPI0003774D3C|nr:ion transporter [Gayadomonas joobiniege]
MMFDGLKQQEQQQVPSPFDIAMMLLSAVSMAIVVAIFILPRGSETRLLLLSIDTMICVLFIIHFIANMVMSKKPWGYFKSHWLELLASIPMIEPLRLLRFLQIFRVIRMIRLARSVIVPMLRQRVQTTLAGLLVLMVLIVAGSAISIFLVESDVEGANIKNAEDALWWGLVTVSTVGYGDYYPVTNLGRIISGLLIVSGVSLFGVISGYIASSFTSSNQEESDTPPLWARNLLQQREKQEQTTQALKDEVARLNQQVKKLSEQLDQQKHD